MAKADFLMSLTPRLSEGLMKITFMTLAMTLSILLFLNKNKQLLQKNKLLLRFVNFIDEVIHS